MATAPLPAFSATSLAPRLARLAETPAFSTLHRSLAVYHGDPARYQAMRQLMSAFVGAGGLAFDVGSHVGDRVAVFRELGAAVVGCEPQPLCASVLEDLFGDVSGVAIEKTAVGADAGEITFHVNSTNPTVSTASAEFIAAAGGADGWEQQTWESTTTVPVTTLDALIAKHGRPDFVKIDVEGFEADVLQGLSEALPALSFEFTCIQKPVAEACLARLSALDAYQFNVAIGETHRLEFPDWVNAERMASYIRALPMAANSGDIYAKHKPAR